MEETENIRASLDRTCTGKSRSAIASHTVPMPNSCEYLVRGKDLGYVPSGDGLLL